MLYIIGHLPHQDKQAIKQPFPYHTFQYLGLDDDNASYFHVSTDQSKFASASPTTHSPFVFLHQPSTVIPTRTALTAAATPT